MRSDENLGKSSHISSCPATAQGFFQGLSPEAIEAFENIQLAMTYPVGALLFIEGEAAQGVFILSKGRVKLSLTSANGKVVILRIVKPGEILGLHAVISNVGFQSTSETLEPCQVSFVRRNDFLRYLREYPQACLLAAKQLSDSYQETCEQLRAIGLSSSAREKVARFLLEWSQRGVRVKEGIRTRLTLTHEEIGQLIGASRETITRVLGDFKGRHWIVIRGSSLVVQDEAALEGVLHHEAISSSALHSARLGGRDHGQPFQSPVTPPFIHSKGYHVGVAAAALRG